MTETPDAESRMANLARDANDAHDKGRSASPEGGWPSRDLADTSGTGAIRHPAETGDLLGSSVSGRRRNFFRARNLAIVGGVVFGAYAVRKGMQRSTPGDDSPADGVQ